VKDNFNPIKGKPGEFRIALNLTELGDRAWEILKTAEELGFEKPQFKTAPRFSGAVEVWAVVLQQFHSYDANTMAVVDCWDEQIDQLRQAVGGDDQFIVIMLVNFAEYQGEPIAV